MTKVGIVVARFQVPTLHEGHHHLMRYALSRADHLVVLLGCSDLDGRTAENPLLFLQRKAVVERFLRDMSHTKTCHVLPLANMKSNREWSRQLDLVVGSMFPAAEATIYVGRDSVVPTCYVGRAAKIEVVPSTPIKISGTEIRQSIEPGSHEIFLQGQTFALQHQFPHAYQCVDLAVVNEAKTDVLLIQRADTGSWCLPGGFVDPTDDSLEAAARRELFEETCLTVEGRLTYLGSALIDDWRYRGRDKIMSALFLAPLCFGSATATKTSEAVDFMWFRVSEWISDGAGTMISESHRPFIFMLRAHLAAMETV